MSLHIVDDDLRCGAFKNEADGLIYCLAGAFTSTPTKKSPFVPVSAPTALMGQPASFEGNCDAFLKMNHDKYPLLEAQMKNKVKKCVCGKNVAFTLSSCNLCGRDLTTTELSYTDNVFTCFMFGIKTFTISLRKQTQKYISFDDILSLSPVHLNCIPTTCYIPDFRYLLREPGKGLQIIGEMKATCMSVLKEQFYNKYYICDNHLEFRCKNFRNGTNISFEEIADKVACGFNYPPSQYQLHLQFIVPPFLPFQYAMFLQGNHFTKGRFIPFEYATAALSKLAIEGKRIDALDLPVDELFARVKAEVGVDYDDVHKQCYIKYETSHRLLSNWSPEDFSMLAAGEKAFIIPPPCVAQAPTEIKGIDAKQQVVTDKMTLQNYGRPYSQEGKFSGTFYGMPSTPAIENWL